MNALFIGVIARSITMSADFGLVRLLSVVQKKLYQIVGPILIVSGTISCVLSLLVFTKKNLRKNPCSIYLVAFNISSLALIFTSILSSTLATGYDIDPSSYDLVLCRFRFYMMFLFDILGPSYLILASIDRVLLTSPNALTRQRSTRRSAFISIIFVTIFWTLFHIHALMFSSPLLIAPKLSTCYFLPGVHTTLMGYYSLVIKGILIPLLMLIFGLWAVKNVRTVAHVTPVSILPTTATATNRKTHTDHSKDRQMLRILLLDIFIYVIFNIMIAIVLIYQQVNNHSTKDPIQVQIERILIIFGVFSTYIPFCIGFYTKFFVSKTFRSEIKKLLLRH